jgi:hypothetical protein
MLPLLEILFQVHSFGEEGGSVLNNFASFWKLMQSYLLPWAVFASSCYTVIRQLATPDLNAPLIELLMDLKRRRDVMTVIICKFIHSNNIAGVTCYV